MLFVVGGKKTTLWCRSLCRIARATFRASHGYWLSYAFLLSRPRFDLGPGPHEQQPDITSSEMWALVLPSHRLLGSLRPAAPRAAKKAFLVTPLTTLGFLIAILSIQSDRALRHTRYQASAIAGAAASRRRTSSPWSSFAGEAAQSAQVTFARRLPTRWKVRRQSVPYLTLARCLGRCYLVRRAFSPCSPRRRTPALRWAQSRHHKRYLLALTASWDEPTSSGVLAYSTIIQLGYMMLALCSGAYVAATFLWLRNPSSGTALPRSAASKHSTEQLRYAPHGRLARRCDHFWTFRIASRACPARRSPASGQGRDQKKKKKLPRPDPERYLFWTPLRRSVRTAFLHVPRDLHDFFGEYSAAPRTSRRDASALTQRIAR